VSTSIEIGQEVLSWMQTRAFNMGFELRDGDGVVATLGFRSLFSSRAVAACGEDRWAFRRVGLWRRRTTVRVEGSDTDLAVFYPSLWARGGVVDLLDGRHYRVATNLWLSRMAMADEGGVSLFTMKVSGIFRLRATVSFPPLANRVAELPWLVLLCCYLIVILQMDRAGGG